MQKMNTASKRGLNKAADILLKEMRRLMVEEAKSGRVYTRGGISHRASAPGEAPASQTGRMVASFSKTKLETPDAPKITISVNAPHFVFTEKGTKFMKPRPLLETALQNKQREIEHAIVFEIAKALRDR